MKKRTMLELRILGEKKYLFIILILWIMSRSAVIAVIFILLRVNLLSDYSDFVNFLCKIAWLICSIWIWNKLSTRRELFLEGKLDWVFGDNLPDEPESEKPILKEREEPLASPTELLINKIYSKETNIPTYEKDKDISN